MNILYATDHKFLKCGERIYSIEFDNSFFTPYKESFRNITVVGRYIERDDIRHIESVDVDFIPMPNISTLSSFFGLRKEIEMKLSQTIEHFDLLIARLPSEIALLSIKAAKKIGKPILVEVAGDPYQILKHYGNIKAYLYAPLMKKRVERAVQSADFVIYVTQSYLQNIYPSSDTAITESISNVRINPAGDDIIVNRVKRFEGGRRVFGTMANIDMRFKGIDTLIEAFSLYHRKYPDSILKIAGAGDIERFRQDLRRMNIEGSVIFDGVIYGERDKWCWFDEVDIYIQPSFAEALPRALTEAMGRGCVAIASNVGGIPELLDREYLFTAGDAEELYRKMLNITQNKDYKSISLTNRDKAVSGYSQESMDSKKKRLFDMIKEKQNFSLQI